PPVHGQRLASLQGEAGEQPRGLEHAGHRRWLRAAGPHDRPTVALLDRVPAPGPVTPAHVTLALAAVTAAGRDQQGGPARSGIRLARGHLPLVPGPRRPAGRAEAP